MKRITELAHDAVRRVVQPGDWVIDATVGNGHDMLFLAGLIGPAGRVFGFDIQAAALDEARTRCASCSNVTLIHSGHHEMSDHLPAEASGRVRAVMFNLGYLPGGDKTVITNSASTLTGLTQAIDVLAPGGVITVIVYPGHAGGDVEAATVLRFAANLPRDFSITNVVPGKTTSPAPELVVIRNQSAQFKSCLPISH